MRKQKLSEALVSITGAQSWIKEKGSDPINNKFQANTYNIFHHYINEPVHHAFKTILKKLKHVLLTSLNGQVILTDEVIRGGSYLHAYNFLGTPQTLFLLPNIYHSSPVCSFENHTIKKLEHTGVKVHALENNRYELVINGIPQHLRINLYNESRQLIFSEQINFKGTYSQVYRLNPFKAEGIHFEVVSKNGVFCSRKL